MSVSHLLTWCPLMFALLAGHGLQLCELKADSPKKKYLGFPENVEKQQVEKWKASKVKLLRSGKQPSVVINAKRAVYELSDGSKKLTIPVIAFTDPKSGSIWVGPEQDAYLEMQAKTLGFRLSGSGIDWCESLLKHGDKAVSPDITKRFEQDVTGYSLIRAAILSPARLAKEKPTSLRPHIKNPWMFTNGPFDSQGATPIVTKIQWDEKLLKLSLTDKTKQFEATVWIDLKSREVKKVVEKPWTLLGDQFKKTIEQ